MHRTAWKKRLTMGLGVGLASVALIAGCGEEDDPINGDGTDLSTDSTATETATLPTADGTMGTATGTATDGTATDGTATATVPDAAGDVPVTLAITTDGLERDDLPADTTAIAAGSAVTFQNDTDSAVNLATDDGTIDEEVEAGGSFEHTFDETGTWTILIDDEEAGMLTVS